MLSIQKQFIFIHYPKTGGNSIQNILRHYSEDQIVSIGTHQDGIERFEVRNKSFKITKHASLSRYREVLDKQEFDKMFKFTCIRNPWERLISLYFSPHRAATHWDKSAFIQLVQQAKTLRDFISLPQKEKVILSNTTSSIKALNIDFIIRFESLQEDFETVCQRIGIPFSPLPHRNKSIRKHYSNYYDDELIEMVREKYQDEIKWGKYFFKHE